MNFQNPIILADDEKSREERKRFENFKNHYDIYAAITDAYIMVGRVFSAKELNRSPDKDLYYASKREWMQNLGGRNNTMASYMAVEKRYIETRVSLPSIPLILSYKNQPALEAAERIIRGYFPGYQIPRSFKKTQTNSQDSFEIGSDMTELLSVEKLTRFKPDFTPAFEVDDAKSGFVLAKGYADRGFSSIAYLELTLQQENVQLNDPNGRYGSQSPSGNLLDGYTAYPKLKVEAVFRWPIDFARWVTCTEPQDTFVPFMFFQYINAHREAYLAKRTRGGGYSTHTPARVNHLGKIVELIAAERKQGRVVKIRTNADGFLILGTGEPASLGAVLWVPIVNNVPEYMAQINSCYDAQEKKIDLTKFKMSGVPVLTDPNNEKFTYIRESGTRGSADISGLITFDLTGSVALDETTIYRHLQSKLNHPENIDLVEKFIGFLMKCAAGNVPGAGDYSSVFTEQAMKDMGFDTFDVNKGFRVMQEAVDFIKTSGLDLRWMNFYSANKITMVLTDRVIVEGTPEAERYATLKKGRAFMEMLFRIAMIALRNFDTMQVGFAQKVEELRFKLYLVARYSTDAPTFGEVYEDKKLLNTAREYTPQEILEPERALSIPNMPGLKRMLPHQVECALDFNMVPEMTLLEADVGGGKGMMGPLQALIYLQKGLIRRPLFLVPGRLVSNWINEIAKYTQGEINPFPLTLSIVRRLQRAYKNDKNVVSRPDYGLLKKIVAACPVNTFFIASLDFLTSDSETITYANSEAERYYVAEFFRDLNVFDLVVIDEAHTVKNITTRATVASSMVTSVAKYKTEMSGTLVSNTMTDLVGESAIANPAALGNVKRFVTNYGLIYTGRGGEYSVSEWKSDAAAMIVNDMKPYAKRIIKKKDRWAFILPKTNELFHTAYLTTNQQSYYDLQISKQMDDLEVKNPALYAKMTASNDKDDESISFGLDMHFQSLEAFIGAPDSDEDYARIPGLSQDDLTSPKLKETIKILDRHFEGYTDDRGEAVAASKFKVVIFAARIPTVEHFERRMPDKYKKRMAVYYAGRENAIEAWLNVPGIDILVAAEMSANTGRNFQIASRLIRTEALWAPGGQIQAAGRIDRPDFEMRGRDEIYLDWIMVNKTLDVAKIARIISKNVQKMKYDRQEDPYFVGRAFTPSDFIKREFGSDLPDMRKPNLTIEKMFTSLPLIKMNFETFKKVNNVSQLGSYFASYALMLDFQNQQFAREKETGLHQLVEVKDSMRAPTLKGSRKINFMPRIPNVDPSFFDPKKQFGYKPISRMETEIFIKKLQSDIDPENFDEDKAVYVEENPVDLEDVVDTEFGIGYVKKILKNEVWVDIPGFRKVRVLKACTWLITNEKTLANIKARLKKGEKFVRTLPGISGADIDLSNLPEEEITESKKPVLAPPVIPPVPPAPRPTDALIAPATPPEDEFDEETQNDNVEEEDVDILDLYAEVIDGQLALTCKSETAADKLISDFGFNHFASYYAFKVKTTKALNDLLRLLKKNYTIPQTHLDDFDAYTEVMRTPGMMEQINPRLFNSTMKFFNIELHRRMPPGTLKPFPIAWGKDLYVAIDVISTPGYQAAIKLIQRAAIPGVIFVKDRQDDVLVKFYKNPADAIAEAKEIAKSIKSSTSHLNEAVKFIQKSRRVPLKVAQAPAPVPAPTAPGRQRPILKRS